MTGDPRVFVHPEGCESDDVGAGTRVWAWAHVLPGAVVGADCNICDHAFVEGGARIGDRVTVKNAVLVFDGVTAEDDVFLGPNVVFTNDYQPRAHVKKGRDERWRPPCAPAPRSGPTPPSCAVRPSAPTPWWGRERGHPRRTRPRPGGRQPGPPDRLGVHVRRRLGADRACPACGRLRARRGRGRPRRAAAGLGRRLRRCRSGSGTASPTRSARRASGPPRSTRCRGWPRRGWTCGSSAPSTGPSPGRVAFTETLRVAGRRVPHRALGVDHACRWHDRVVEAGAAPHAGAAGRRPRLAGRLPPDLRRRPPGRHRLAARGAEPPHGVGVRAGRPGRGRPRPRGAGGALASRRPEAAGHGERRVRRRGLRPRPERVRRPHLRRAGPRPTGCCGTATGSIPPPSRRRRRARRSGRSRSRSWATASRTRACTTPCVPSSARG